jgi:hypothetical protein
MNIARAIKHIRPTSQWVCNGSYETLVWLDGNSEQKPTKEEIDLAWNSISNNIAWEQTRLNRDTLLSKSDWTQLADSKADKLAWAAYRQNLRDIPQNFDTPESVVWPSKP